MRADTTRFAAFYYNTSLSYGDHVGDRYKDYAIEEHSTVLDLEARAVGRDTSILLTDGHFR